MNDTLWWALVALMMVAGVAGTVLPALPGTLLIFGAALLGAWIDDFARVGTVTLVVLGALALLSWVLEYAAGLMGARRVGASREALIGATVGTVGGLLLGLVGVLVLPLVGAAVGEWIALRRRGVVAVPAAGGGAAAAAGTGTGARAVAAAVAGTAAADGQRAVKVGVATWVGMMVGMIAKVVIAFTMVGLFLVALWV